jgi:hypothetical protein
LAISLSDGLGANVLVLQPHSVRDDTKGAGRDSSAFMQSVTLGRTSHIRSGWIVD